MISICLLELYKPLWVWLLGQQRTLKGLALPHAWNAGDVSPPERSRRSDTRAAVAVLFAHAYSLFLEVYSHAFYSHHSLVTVWQRGRYSWTLLSPRVAITHCFMLLCVCVWVCVLMAEFHLLMLAGALVVRVIVLKSLFSCQKQSMYLVFIHGLSPLSTQGVDWFVLLHIKIFVL